MHIRRKVFALIMSFTLVFTMMPMMASPVFAADETMIDSIDINYDANKLLYNVAYTEGESDRSMYNNVTVSQGVKFNQGNSSLMIRQANGEFWGIGDGINPISTSKTYYYCYAVYPENGYTWPEAITSLPNNKVGISTVPEITVKVNNTLITYGFIQKGSTIVRIYIPMERPSTSPVVKSVAINESDVSVVRGESTSLSATVTGTAADTVTWSVSDKTSNDTTIDNDGNLVIGEDEELGSVTVTATSTADTSKSASITVIVSDASLTVDSVTVSPNTVSLYTGKSRQFEATVEGSEIDKRITWSVKGASSTDTKIDDTGKLDIGENETAETLTVKATSVKDCTKVGTATVTVLQRTMISNVNISYDTSKILFSETSTEGEFNRSMYNNVTVSQGFIFNQGNSSLVTRQGNGEFWGIGDGTALIDVNKAYYYLYALDTEDAYKWPESVTSLQNGKKVDISTVSGLTVKVNNTSITDGFIQMTSYFVWFYIPIESLIHTCEKESMVQKLPATVSADGNKAYYVCSCGEWYWDEDCTQLIENHDDVIIPKSSSIKLSTTAYTYSGGVKTPSLYVKDSKGNSLKYGTDYTYTRSSGRKNVGTYNYYITFKGNYAGKKTVSFKINPKGTTIKTPYRYKGAIKARWSKRSTKMSKSRIYGYQIAYATRSDFSNAKYAYSNKYSYTSKKISKLKRKTYYYVKVRTRMKVGGVWHYSSWSKVKKIKTK